MDFDCFIFDLHDLYLVCLRLGCAHVLLASRGSCINGSYLLRTEHPVIVAVNMLWRPYVAHYITCLYMMLRFVYCDSGIFQVASLSLLSSPPPIHLRSSTNFEVSLSLNRKEPGLLFPSEETRRAATFRFVLPPQTPRLCCCPGYQLNVFLRPE